MKLIKNIPNGITLINLMLGVIAMLVNDPIYSPLLILAAGAADHLDGLFARLLNARSELGEQLDSLADLVSFGLAPAFLFYHHVMPETILAMILVSIVPAIAAVRLAKYNTVESEGDSFIGLPSPSSGLFFAFLVYFLEGSIMQFPEWLVLLFPPVFSLLMVSPVNMFSIKNFSQKSGFEKIMVALLGLSALVLFILFQFESIPAIVLIYILLSVLNNIAGKSG